jgi:endonuclease/exonuclease/phosphatase (EEP) superfamily protein YafD
MYPLRRRVARVFFILAACYGLLGIAALAVRLAFGERWIVSSVVTMSLQFLLMPSLVLLPVCLIARRPRTALLLAPGFVAFMAVYAVFFLPRSSPVPSDAPRIRLLTYNMHAERSLLKPMADVIRSSGADIVAMQEFSPEAAQYIDTALSDLYPYRALHPVSSPYHGRGILSRYPIQADKAWPEEYPIPVRLQRVEILAQGQHLTIYNMHAPPSFPIYGQGLDFGPRGQQISDLLALASADAGAVILMGDFNTLDLDENYAHITAQYHDAYREMGWGLGFTNPDWSWENSREGLAFIPPYQRVDYVFYRGPLATAQAQVWPTSGGSDHRPVYVELGLLSGD